MDWLYFVAKTDDGNVLLIVRRNRWGSGWGPIIEMLTHDSGWTPAPQLLTRFHDPGYLEAVTPEQAHAAATTSGAAWFATDDDPDPSFPSPNRPV